MAPIHHGFAVADDQRRALARFEREARLHAALVLLEEGEADGASLRAGEIEGPRLTSCGALEIDVYTVMREGQCGLEMGPCRGNRRRKIEGIGEHVRFETDVVLVGIARIFGHAPRL